MLELNTAVIQTQPEFGDIGGNVERALAMIPPGCDLAVLPELFATGYQFLSRDEALGLAEDPRSGGPVMSALGATAASTRTTLIAGIAERDGDRVFNSSVLVRPDRSWEIYRKVHLFWNEKEIFDPGDLGFPVFEACGTRIGMMVCFDWIFPEAARTLALAGAEVIAHPANLILPWCPAAMITRSQENRVFTITANRIGSEERDQPALKFIGMSQIVDPLGEIVVRLDSEREGAASAALRVREKDKLITPTNDLWKDRRPDQYDC